MWSRLAFSCAAQTGEPCSRLSSPRLRAASLSPRPHGLTPFRPSGGSAREGRGREPRAVDQIGARSPGRWGDAVEAPALQSKPVAPASRLVARVAPSVALGLGLRIPAAGPARVRLYSYRERLSAQPSKAVRMR